MASSKMCAVLLLVFGQIVAAVSTGYICCASNEWESNTNITMLIYSPGQTARIEGSQIMSYDTNRRMIALQQDIRYNGFPVKQRMVLEYDQKSSYLITTAGSCTKYTLPTLWHPPCVPAGSNLTASTTMNAYGTGMVEVKSFSFFLDGDVHHVTVTSDTCTPVTESITPNTPSGLEVTGVAQNLTFINISEGLADPTVFDVAPDCHAAPHAGSLPVFG